MGKPTDLVRDGDTEGRDPVPDEQFRVPPTPLGQSPQGVGGLERADDPRSWEPGPPISERAVARRQMKERAREVGPLYYWLLLRPGVEHMIAWCVIVGGVVVGVSSDGSGSSPTEWQRSWQALPIEYG